MARTLDLSTLADDIRKRLLRSFQSGHVNFLLGSGASQPAIAIAGAVESEISVLIAEGKNDEATARMYSFLSAVHAANNKIIAGDHVNELATTLEEYRSFLRTIEDVLTARRTTLLPRQVTIFSTNYDLFVESAASACPTVSVNDGFTRSPGIGFRMEFSSRNYFKASYNTGNLYDYRVEVPCINLIKLHGSFSWKRIGGDIVFDANQTTLLADDSDLDQKRKFVEDCAVVLPQAAKFREILMDRTYYDLLRIFANSLDRENSVLIVFGFSFLDEHIRDITVRALKNPTLRVVIFAFNAAAKESYATLFQAHNNVEIISDAEPITFAVMNKMLGSLLRQQTEAKQ
jgi:hypothetical protein